MEGLKTGRCPLVFLGVLFLHVGWVLGDWEHSCSLETKREGPQGICGSRLPDVLDLVCRVYGGYTEKWFRKRSDEDSKNRIKDIILGKRDALAYLSKRSTSSFGEQGITCECCYHRCSYSELRQYCKSSQLTGGRRPLHLGRK
ncbi:con-Ins Im2-like [Haliotis asinina]|uniref:con-Ins Im2-like n=1 Tax=Haliotis asinina TaxID=109174 RepID=UPI0035324EC7